MIVLLREFLFFWVEFVVEVDEFLVGKSLYMLLFGFCVKDVVEEFVFVLVVESFWIDVEVVVEKECVGWIVIFLDIGDE